MFETRKTLENLENENKHINVAIVGIGKMGKSLLDRLFNIAGFNPKLLVNRSLDVIDSLPIDKEHIVYVKSPKDVDNLKLGQIGLTDQADLAFNAQSIDCIVEATGSTCYGAHIAYNTIESGKHIVMLNVECDATIGPILYHMAKDKGVIYTGSAGDEPGAIIELMDFAYSLDFEIIACGKGKNNPKNIHATADDLIDQARDKKLNPQTLVSFVDTTNTMIELNVVANATGFLPDTYGCHGIVSSLEELPKKLELKENGGILSSHQILDYVHGIAPGVFVAVKAKTKETEEIFKYTGLGQGPIYILYRPFHLCSLETPRTIYNAVIKNLSDLVPEKGQVADVVAHAKRDIKKGEYIQGIGSADSYGNLTDNKDARERNLLPIGLIGPNTRAKTDIKKDQVISYDMVDLDQDSLIVNLRKKQDDLFV